MATDPNTVRHYNENAENYNRHVSDPTDSTFHSYYEKPAIRAELPSLNGLEVISIGCGSGVDARWLSDNGAKKVVGIDISSGLLDIAKKNHPDIEFHEMDMEQLAFPDESFDLAYSSLAIHYVDDWTVPLKEAYRILRPDGLYVFSCGHPIDSAVEFEVKDGVKYALLGRKVNQETRERTVYGDYLAAKSNGVKPVRGIVADVELTVYHRTFSKMVEQILASGFGIEKVVEPQPTDGMKAVDPAIYEQLTRIPTFMIWVLRKK
ncbi:MAG TPA: class I SAM-dependent methyltransferase [Candidatus Dormibacteraeota bacterium]|nr:class I SAM-dependent methyltransferase [Candidatus Dormibacteraeota bacterium]